MESKTHQPQQQQQGGGKRNRNKNKNRNNNNNNNNNCNTNQQNNNENLNRLVNYQPSKQLTSKLPDDFVSNYVSNVPTSPPKISPSKSYHGGFIQGAYSSPNKHHHNDQDSYYGRSPNKNRFNANSTSPLNNHNFNRNGNNYHQRKNNQNYNKKFNKSASNNNINQEYGMIVSPSDPAISTSASYENQNLFTGVLNELKLHTQVIDETSNGQNEAIDCNTSTQNTSVELQSEISENQYFSANEQTIQSTPSLSPQLENQTISDELHTTQTQMPTSLSFEILSEEVHVTSSKSSGSSSTNNDVSSSSEDDLEISANVNMIKPESPSKETEEEMLEPIELGDVNEVMKDIELDESVSSDAKIQQQQQTTYEIITPTEAAINVDFKNEELIGEQEKQVLLVSSHSLSGDELVQQDEQANETKERELAEEVVQQDNQVDEAKQQELAEEVVQQDNQVDEAKQQELAEEVVQQDNQVDEAKQQELSEKPIEKEEKVNEEDFEVIQEEEPQLKDEQLVEIQLDEIKQATNEDNIQVVPSVKNVEETTPIRSLMDEVLSQIEDTQKVDGDDEFHQIEKIDIPPVDSIEITKLTDDIKELNGMTDTSCKLKVTQEATNTKTKKQVSTPEVDCFGCNIL